MVKGAKRGRVVVAMSGGVDSAVAAAILAREGYDVVGITMRLWSLDDPGAPVGKRRCCSVEDTDDARQAADAIGIPHYVLNMERAFRERVVDEFVAEYARGRTPNPCLACNEHVKFRALLDRAIALEADYLATGHYARIERAPDGRYRLLRAVDAAKDQSYVLYPLGQAELSRTLFPVGGYDKPAIRAIARELGLGLAEKRDSADICFVPDGDYRAFVRQRTAPSPGEIRGSDGRVLGRHEGVEGFTVGQRRGLGIAAGTPVFVTSIDASRGIVTVGGEDELYAKGCTVERLHWVADAPATPVECAVKVRYRTPAASATVRTVGAGEAAIAFAEPQRALTPGQAAVFYDGDEVLGGGIISAVQR